MKKKEQEVIELPAEEIPHVRTVEEAVKPDIVVFDKYAARCQELTEMYAGITINGVEDKEGYTKAKEAARELRGMRTGTENDRKAAKAFYLECGRVIDKKAELIENVILKLETPIKNQIKAVDDENDRIRVERIEKEKERLRARISLLTFYGAVSDGVDVKLDDLSYSNETIRESEDDYFNEKIVPQFKEIFDSKETIRIANEKALREERERQEQHRKDAERQQQILKEQQAEIDRQNKELEKRKFSAIEEKKKARYNQLMEMGLIYDFKYESFVMKDVNVHQTDIAVFDDEQWDNLISEITPVIADRKKQIQDEKDKEQDRLNKEAIEKHEREKIQQEELRRQQERQELELGKDSERWLFFIKLLKAVDEPVMTSWRYKTMMTEAHKLIEQVITMKVPK